MLRGRDWVGRRAAPSTKVLTTFVANIPLELDIHGLRGIFAVAGEIREVSIPPLQTSKSRFGFVRYANVSGVENSIRLLHSKVVRGCKLVVQEARSERRGRSILRDSNVQGSYRMANHFKGPERVRFQNHVGRKPQQNFAEEKEEAVDIRVVKGVVNERNFQWLFKCLIGESDVFCDLEELNSILVKEVEGLIRVKKLQWNQYILQFESSHLANQALTTSEVLKDSFPLIRSWSWYDVCKERPVWLEVIGVPPLGWKTQNFSQIVGKSGNFVCLEKDLSEILCFESIKVLIITNEMRRIDEYIHFDLEDKIFDVHVKESSSWSIMDDMSWLVAKPAITPISSEEPLAASPSVPQPVQPQVLSQLNPTNFVSNIFEANNVQINEEGAISSNANGSNPNSLEDCANSSSYNTRVEESPVVGNSFEKEPGGFSNEVIEDSEEESEEVHEVQECSSLDPAIGLKSRGKKLEAKRKKSGLKIGKVNRFLENSRRVREAPKKLAVNSYPNNMSDSTIRLAQDISHSVSSSDSVRRLSDKSILMGNLLGCKVVNNVDGVKKRISRALKKSRAIALSQASLSEAF